MRRFFVSSDFWKPDIINLPEQEFHHAFHVLRLKEGACVCVFNEKEQVAEGTIKYIGDSKGLVKNLSITNKDSSKRPIKIILGQCLPKQDKFETILQHATELGISTIAPVSSKRSVVKLVDKNKISERKKRWQRIACESSKQCMRGSVPYVLDILSIKDFCNLFEQSSKKRGIILYESLNNDLDSRFKLYHYLNNCRNEDVEEIWLIVGSEGGFCEDEVSIAMSAGFLPISLGTRILRTETASLAILSMLQYIIEMTP